MRKARKPWRVPWTEVRHGTEYEEDDVDLNMCWATLMLDGQFIWTEEMDAAPDDPVWRWEQGVAVMDDVLIALDVLGWKVVAKDDPAHGYPILRDDDFRPDWCG
jgi:hypothetical protein